MTELIARRGRVAKRTLVAVGALGAVAALSACTAPRPGAAATVGSGRIESSDLADRVDALVAMPTFKNMSRVTLQREVLAELITDRVDDAVAKKAGVTASEAEITATIDSYKASAGAKTDAEVEAALLSSTSPSGSSQTPEGYAGLQTFARDNVLISRLRTAYAANLPITDAGLRALYDSNPTAFNSADISAIVLTDAAKAQADYLKVSKNPAIFGDVAKIDSLATQSAASGGEIGSLPEGRLGAVIDSAVYAAKPGDILKPISDQGAYVVIKVNSLTVKSFEDARSDLTSEAKNPNGAPTVAAISQERQATAGKLGVWVNPRFGGWAGSTSIPSSGASSASITAPDSPLSTLPGVIAVPTPPASLVLPGDGSGTTGGDTGGTTGDTGTGTTGDTGSGTTGDTSSGTTGDTGTGTTTGTTGTGTP